MHLHSFLVQFLAKSYASALRSRVGVTCNERMYCYDTPSLPLRIAAAKLDIRAHAV